MDSEDDLDGVILKWNSMAMDHLKNGAFEKAHQLLTNAEEILSSTELSHEKLKLLSITLNNLGCFYKRKGKLNFALKYLNNALKIEEQHETDLSNIAGTHLNLWAIYSQLNKHGKALVNASKALDLLKQWDDEQINTMTTMIIAYHNLGVESEYLGEITEAKQAYRQGFELARTHLSISHSLTQSLKESYMSLQKSQVSRSVETHTASVANSINTTTGATFRSPFNSVDHSMEASEIRLHKMARSQQRHMPSSNFLPNRHRGKWGHIHAKPPSKHISRRRIVSQIPMRNTVREPPRMNIFPQRGRNMPQRGRNVQDSNDQEYRDTRRNMPIEAPPVVDIFSSRDFLEDSPMNSQLPELPALDRLPSPPKGTESPANSNLPDLASPRSKPRPQFRFSDQMPRRESQSDPPDIPPLTLPDINARQRHAGPSLHPAGPQRKQSNAKIGQITPKAPTQFTDKSKISLHNPPPKRREPSESAQPSPPKQSDHSPEKSTQTPIKTRHEDQITPPPGPEVPNAQRSPRKRDTSPEKSTQTQAPTPSVAKSTPPPPKVTPLPAKPQNKQRDQSPIKSTQTGGPPRPTNRNISPSAKRTTPAPEQPSPSLRDASPQKPIQNRSSKPAQIQNTPSHAKRPPPRDSHKTKDRSGKKDSPERDPIKLALQVITTKWTKQLRYLFFFGLKRLPTR